MTFEGGGVGEKEREGKSRSLCARLKRPRDRFSRQLFLAHLSALLKALTRRGPGQRTPNHVIQTWQARCEELHGFLNLWHLPEEAYAQWDVTFHEDVCASIADGRTISLSTFERWLKDLADLWFDCCSSGKWHHQLKCTPVSTQLLLINMKGQYVHHSATERGCL